MVFSKTYIKNKNLCHLNLLIKRQKPYVFNYKNLLLEQWIWNIRYELDCDGLGLKLDPESERSMSNLRVSHHRKMSYEVVFQPQNYFIIVLQENGIINARRIASVNTENIQMEHGKKHDGKGIMHRSQRRIFWGPFFRHSTGDKFMTVKCEWTRKLHLKALDRPPNYSIASLTDFLQPPPQPDKRSTRHTNASGKLHAQLLGLKAVRFTLWVSKMAGSDARPGRKRVGSMAGVAQQASAEGSMVPSVQRNCRPTTED